MKRVLIANRGEIALRIVRACHEEGLEAVAVYSTADRQSPHVRAADRGTCIGEAPPGESYLAIERLIDAARHSGSAWRSFPHNNVGALEKLLASAGEGAFPAALIAGVPLGLVFAGMFGWHAPFLILGVAAAANLALGAYALPPIKIILRVKSMMEKLC